ncbi:MAG: hypothetical protein ACR2QR_01480, partial [Woeseiaceae bacterium]
MSGSKYAIDATALQQRLASAGFVLSPQACAPELIEQLLSVSHTRIHEIREALGDKDIGVGSAAGYDEIVQRSPGRWDIPISPQQFGVDDRELPWWPLVAET